MRLRAFIMVIAFQSNVGGIKDIDWDGGTCTRKQCRAGIAGLF